MKRPLQSSSTSTEQPHGDAHVTTEAGAHGRGNGDHGAEDSMRRRWVDWPAWFRGTVLHAEQRLLGGDFESARQLFEHAADVAPDEGSEREMVERAAACWIAQRRAA